MTRRDGPLQPLVDRERDLIFSTYCVHSITDSTLYLIRLDEQMSLFTKMTQVELVCSGRQRGCVHRIAKAPRIARFPRCPVGRQDRGRFLLEHSYLGISISMSVHPVNLNRKI